ncbi:hypothetical protein LCL89_05530 [Halobacillus yeomjeoni]|uniref:hypothetical protein n=1 Tax=Halobacillus yeomjeoni TaxID=311194 RepID=UPI001CD80918|nr:hypothetical protein [Halobacillus yeomjeoni]MCA0983513.1 hypothetical protein [Halobacillus yeomjeoni]
MERKSIILAFGVVGILSVSIGFSNVLAKGETNDQLGDTNRVVTAEEQNKVENKTVEDKSVTTVITAEEQNRVENSSAPSGFVKQEDGTGFYFMK